MAGVFRARLPARAFNARWNLRDAVEDVWHPARVVARGDAGGGLSVLTVEAARDVLATYTSPGQYIEVRVRGETGYFVLASDPGAHAWELILRAGGGASDVLLAMGAGGSIEVSTAIGAGFPMNEARGRPVIIALSGTGIAAARPLVHRRIADGDAARTQLLVGVRARAELPIEATIDRWAAEGLRVVVCLSQPLGHAAPDDARFRRGYVQDVLRGHPDLRPPPGARIFAVGLSSMIDALRELAPALGIAPGHVYTNH
jgi:sulfhydrogenase subunit gamma (sulfur reductase)